MLGYLNDLNPNKAPGPDGIHARILKVCAVNLAHPLSVMFNLSYRSGCIPSDWKDANAVPVFKKGSKCKAENYRPISLTCIIMKVFEKIVKQELWVHTHPFIDHRQHGFVGSKSCASNLLEFCDN